MSILTDTWRAEMAAERAQLDAELAGARTVLARAEADLKAAVDLADAYATKAGKAASGGDFSVSAELAAPIRLRINELRHAIRTPASAVAIAKATIGRLEEKLRDYDLAAMQLDGLDHELSDPAEAVP